MTEFRDAIAHAVADSWGGSFLIMSDQRSADAVLAMPEMQLLKRTLRSWAEYAGSYDHMGAEYALREMMKFEPSDEQPFSDSFIAWVLDGES